MYATITALTFKSPEDCRAAIAALGDLLPAARELPGFHALYVVAAGEAQATMVTLYASEAAAEAGSAQLRPQLGQALGVHVSGPPRRASGAVLLTS